MQTFSEPAVGFSVGIPDGWVVLPLEWVKKFRQSAAPTSEQLASMLNKADTPFLCAYRPHPDSAAVIPTLQCIARPAHAAAVLGGVSGAMNVALSYLYDAFPDLMVLDRLDDYLLAGLRGAYLKASMSIVNEAGGRFDCASELIVLQSPRVLYVLGLSGPADPSSRPCADFDAMLLSLRID